MTAHTAAAARAPRASRATAWRMLRMQVRVEQLVFWRNLSTMFFTFVLPIVMLFVVAASNDPRDSVALILALAILSTGFQGLAIQLVMHRDQGVLKRVMATPLQPWVLILGKALSTCIVIAIELVIMVAVGMLAFGAPFPVHPLALLVVLLLGTATFVALGFAMASIIGTTDSAPAMVNAVYLALILASVLLHVVEALPAIVRNAGQALPLVHLFEPMQHAWMGGWSGSDWISCLVMAAWCAAASLWTARRFRWEPVEER